MWCSPRRPPSSASSAGLKDLPSGLCTSRCGESPSPWATGSLRASRFTRQNDDVLITVVDDGPPYNPLADFAQGDLSAPGTLAAIIVTGFTEDVEYDRVLDLNHLSMLVKPTAELRAFRRGRTRCDIIAAPKFPPNEKDE